MIEIGRTCRTCRQRSFEVDPIILVCPNCLSIKIPCPICGEPMPKYKKRGALRKVCSSRCNKLAHPTTSEQAKKANQTKWAGHIYKTHQNRNARDKSDYANWRKAVFERDNYTCQDCGAHNGNGIEIKLHPHHIQPFATHAELRYDVSNGVTLCSVCHRQCHNHVFIGRVHKQAEDQLLLPIAPK